MIKKKNRKLKTENRIMIFIIYCINSNASHQDSITAEDKMINIYCPMEKLHMSQTK